MEYMNLIGKMTILLKLGICGTVDKLLPTTKNKIYCRPDHEMSLFTDRDGIYYVAYSLKSLSRGRPLGHHLSIDKISSRNGSRHLFENYSYNWERCPSSDFDA